MAEPLAYTIKEVKKRPPSVACPWTSKGGCKMAVYKRGDRSGRWMFAFDVERGRGERRQQVRRTGFRTKREAEAAERQAHFEEDQGVRIREADISLAAFFD